MRVIHLREDIFQNFLRYCIPTKVVQTKIRVVILKTKGRKNEKLKFIARFTKTKTKNKKLPKNAEKIKIEKRKETQWRIIYRRLISFPEPSPSVVGREFFKQLNLFLEYSNSQFRFSDKRAADIQ